MHDDLNVTYLIVRLDSDKHSFTTFVYHDDETNRVVLHNPRCSAHDNTFCLSCSLNPICGHPDFEGGCMVYAETGMHWDTCPERVRR